MSQFQHPASTAVEQDSSTPQPTYSWLDPDAEVEVLATDDDGKPYLVVGSFQGIDYPTGGGPTAFIVRTAEGDVPLHMEDVVGVTPVDLAATER